MTRPQLVHPPSANDEKLLDGYFRQLSAGEISRREFEEATRQEWWWGDILEGLEKRNLSYPIVEPKRTDAQQKLTDKVF